MPESLTLEQITKKLRELEEKIDKVAKDAHDAKSIANSIKSRPK